MDMILIVGAVLVVLGIVGSITPALPGPALSFIGLVLLYVEKPESVSVFSLVIFGLAMVVLVLFDYIAPVFGAKFSGATKRGITGAVAGMLIGFILFPPLGIFIGAFVGAFLGEVIGGKTPEEALKAGIGTLVGTVGNIILQTIYSLILAVYFFVKLF